MMPKYSDAVEQLIAEEYASGSSTPTLSRKWGIDHKTVTAIVHRRGGRMRSLKESNKESIVKARGSRHFPIRHVNHAFFEDIQTESQAWLLGFVMADGHVIPGRRLAINLARRDREILIKIAELLGSTNPAISDFEAESYGRVRPYSMLRIESKQVAVDLARWGLVGKKTYRQKIPDIPERLLPHLYRGLVDGDGSISIRSSARATISLCGNQYTVRSFASYFGPKIGSLAKVRRRLGSRCWDVRYAGVGMPRALAILLYGSATVSLQRKWLLAEKVMQLEPKRRLKRPLFR